MEKAYRKYPRQASWTGFDLGSSEFNYSVKILQVRVDESPCAT